MRKIFTVLALIVVGVASADYTIRVTPGTPSVVNVVNGVVQAVSEYTPPADCVLWAEATYGVETNGAGEVLAWRDRSASHADFTNAASTAVLTTNILNGLPVLRFNGADSYLRNTLSAFSDSHTIIIVATIRGTTSASGYSTEVSYDAGALDRGAPHFYYSGSDKGASYPFYPVGGYYDPGAQNIDYGVFYMFALPWQVGSWSAWLNGALDGSATGTENPTLVTGLKLGAHTPDGVDARWWQGDVAAVMVWSRVLSNAEINNVQAYLSAQWGITVAELP